MSASRLSVAAIVVGAFGSLSIGAQQVLPLPLRGGPPSDVPVAVQILRWHMNDADLAALTFRSMDRLFTTRTVARSGPVWTLPRSEHPLDFTYEWLGETVPAADVLERTFTNALLIMKDGRVVSEIYRNNTDADSHFIGWSMTKSITSVLIGCALAEGRIPLRRCCSYAAEYP